MWIHTYISPFKLCLKIPIMSDVLKEYDNYISSSKFMLKNTTILKCCSLGRQNVCLLCVPFRFFLGAAWKHLLELDMFPFNVIHHSCTSNINRSSKLSSICDGETTSLSVSFKTVILGSIFTSLFSNDKASFQWERRVFLKNCTFTTGNWKRLILIFFFLFFTSHHPRSGQLSDVRL